MKTNIGWAKVQAQLSSVEFKMVFMRSEKPICAPPRLLLRTFPNVTSKISVPQLAFEQNTGQIRHLFIRSFLLFLRFLPPNRPAVTALDDWA